jgi:hypothetical protein
MLCTLRQCYTYQNDHTLSSENHESLPAFHMMVPFYVNGVKVILHE